MSPVNPDLLAQDLAVIRKRRGDSGTRMGDQVEPIIRIPLESPTLMRVTTGGIPVGRITRLYGDPSTGKTHLAYLIMAAAQELKVPRFPNGMTCAYWNIEGIYDEVHARQLGVQTNKLVLKDTKVIEEVAGDMELLLRSVHLHVVDSTSDAKCVDELAAEPEDWQIGLNAKAWKRAMNRIEAKFDGDENVIILISHVGEKVDIRRHTSYKIPKDGKHLEYVSSMNLEFTAGSWLYYHPDGHLEKDDKIKEEAGVSYSGMKEADGIEVSVRCKKNRVGRQFFVGKMRFDLNTFRFDTTFELLDAASFYDEDGVPAHRSGQPAIIRRTGEKSSWFTLPDGTKVQGSRGIRAKIDEDQELSSLVRRAMLSGN